MWSDAQGEKQSMTMGSKLPISIQERESLVIVIDLFKYEDNSQ